MKSCARTVLRPFCLAREVACLMSQFIHSLRPSRASPAVLQPAALIAAFTLLPTESGSPPPPPLRPAFFALAMGSLLCPGSGSGAVDTMAPGEEDRFSLACYDSAHGSRPLRRGGREPSRAPLPALPRSNGALRPDPHRRRRTRSRGRSAPGRGRAPRVVDRALRGHGRGRRPPRRPALAARARPRGRRRPRGDRRRRRDDPLDRRALSGVEGGTPAGALRGHTVSDRPSPAGPPRPALPGRPSIGAPDP